MAHVIAPKHSDINESPSFAVNPSLAPQMGRQDLKASAYACAIQGSCVAGWRVAGPSLAHRSTMSSALRTFVHARPAVAKKSARSAGRLLMPETKGSPLFATAWAHASKPTAGAEQGDVTLAVMGRTERHERSARA